MDLEIFVYLLCRFLGENRIYTVQFENSFTSGAHPPNWFFGLAIENRSRKDWHSDSFPQADSGCQPCGLQTAPLGYYTTADAGYVDEDGYVYVMSRTDDIINVAGHRLSTGGMEEVLASHPDVAECAVVGVHDELKGQIPVGFLVLKKGVDRNGQEIVTEVVQMVRQKIGPVAAFRTAVVVPALPKTRSGKVLRGTMQKIADGNDYKMPATIDDSSALTEIAKALSQVGYAKKQGASSVPSGS